MFSSFEVRTGSIPLTTFVRAAVAVELGDFPLADRLLQETEARFGPIRQAEELSGEDGGEVRAAMLSQVQRSAASGFRSLCRVQLKVCWDRGEGEGGRGDSRAKRQWNAFHMRSPRTRPTSSTGRCRRPQAERVTA